MSTYTELRHQVLVNVEGNKAAAYLDSVNIPTIGIGQKEA